MPRIPAHITGERAIFLEGLQQPFRDAVKETLCIAASRGALLVPFCGYRDPERQARLWRQSRSLQQIDDKIMILRKRKAPLLAELIERAGPQYGAPATQTIPGQSPHQYGLALDSYLLTEFCEAEWDEAAPGYAIFAKAAEEQGLMPGQVYGVPFHVQWNEMPFDPLRPASMESALKEALSFSHLNSGH